MSSHRRAPEELACIVCLVVAAAKNQSNHTPRFCTTNGEHHCRGASPCRNMILVKNNAMNKVTTADELNLSVCVWWECLFHDEEEQFFFYLRVLI